MTAPKSWPNSCRREMGAEVDYQVAAPAEMRTPNLHRANHRSQKSADGRMATEAARLKRKEPTGRKTGLTLTGLLMEGRGQSSQHQIVLFGSLSLRMQRSPAIAVQVPSNRHQIKSPALLMSRINCPVTVPYSDQKCSWSAIR